MEHLVLTTMEPTLPDTDTEVERAVDDDVVARVLATAERRAAGHAVFGSPAPIAPVEPVPSADGEQFDLEERQALRRVTGLSSELEDVTEAEYRQLWAPWRL